MTKAADYQVNSVKCDPSGSGHFAIRTNFDPDDEREWKIVALGDVSHYATHDAVADWLDMKVQQ